MYSSAPDLATRVASLLNAREHDGAMRFSDEEISHFLAYVTFQVIGTQPGAEIPHEMLAVFDEKLRELQLREDSPPEMVVPRLVSHFEAHPPNAILLAQLGDVLRQQLAQCCDRVDHRRFDKVTGRVRQPLSWRKDTSRGSKALLVNVSVRV